MTFASHVLRLARPFAALAPLALGCSQTAPLDGDAATPAPDAQEARDAGTAAPDAAPERDAFVARDAGPPPAGCFEEAVTIWTSSAGPSERAHAEVLGAAAFEHGWLVAVSGLHDGEHLVTLDREGAVRAVQPIELYGARTRAFVLGGALYLFAGNRVSRHEVGATGIVESHPYGYVGGLAPRNDGTVAVEVLPGGEGFRALTLHYDEAEAEYRLRVSELRPDASEPSGLAQVSGTLAPIPGLAVEAAQLFLAGDHVWAIARGAALRVLDVQLGLGSLGAPDEVGTRVWTDEVWSDPPAQVLELTADRRHALTAREAPAFPGAVGRLERLPPGGAERLELGAGLELGYGLLATAMRELDERVVVATASRLGVYRRSDGAELGATELAAQPNTPLALLSRGEEVAVAFVEDASEGRRVALRCRALPAAAP